ncbi:MAG TPA: hypothetical protein V6D02_12475, partial [Candidatus Obscuribacterales bacterium]
MLMFRGIPWGVSMVAMGLLFPMPSLAQACGEAAIRQHLQAMVQTTDWEMAVGSIAACEAAAMPGLVMALNQGSRDERLEAIAALETLLALPAATADWVDQTPQLTEALIARLQTDADEQVREQAALSLGTVAALSQEAARHTAIAQALITAGADNQNSLAVHIGVTSGLGQVPTEADIIIPALSPLVSDP